MDARLERIVAELEANLIVAFAGCTVTDCVGAGFARNFDLSFGDQRARDRSAEQVFAFVDRVRADRR